MQSVTVTEKQICNLITVTNQNVGDYKDYKVTSKYIVFG